MLNPAVQDRDLDPSRSHPGSSPDAVSYPVVDERILAAFMAERTPTRNLRVLSIFCSELAEKREMLDVCIQNKDAVTLRRLVHTMKGSGMIAGAAKLAQQSKIIEDGIVASNETDWAAAAELKTTILETMSAYGAVVRRIMITT